MKQPYKKLIISYICIILAILLCSIQQAIAAKVPRDVLQKIRARGVLIVGMESNSPPMNYTDKFGKRKGFDYELALEIAKIMGIPNVEVKEAGYETLPELLRQRKVDIIMGGYVPDPSIESVEWSNGYYEFGLCLVVRASSAVRNVSHLTGKTIAIYNDPAAEEWVKNNIPRAQIRKYEGDSGWFEAIESGDADALIYDYPFAVTEIQQYKKSKIVELNLNKSRYAIGVLTRNYDLIDEINAAIKKIQGSSRFPQMIKTYLSYESEELTMSTSASRSISDTTASGTKQKTYVVKRGDSLSSIAIRKLGSANKWRDIWNANKNRISHPSLIQVGWVLTIP